MIKSETASSAYSNAFVSPSDIRHLSRTDLIGKRVMYRYHRKDWDYFGKVVEILKDQSVKVELDSGVSIVRKLSSFDVK